MVNKKKGNKQTRQKRRLKNKTQRMKQQIKKRERQRGGTKKFSHGRTGEKSWLYRYFRGL